MKSKSLSDIVRDTEEKLKLADKMESDIKAQRENADAEKRAVQIRYRRKQKVAGGT
ncbi:MAG: hypothetical protein L6V85_06850 [Clostridiales bacterium]|nr:MAG: hypothetical protein L6V85_06850 [Clostridiales bacterium]